MPWTVLALLGTHTGKIQTCPVLQSLSHLSDPSLSLSFPQPEGRTGGRVYFKPGPHVPFVTMEISALRKETAVRSHPPHRAAQPSRMELMALPTSPSSWWQWTCGLSLPPSFSRCLHQLPPPVQVQRIPPGRGPALRSGSCSLPVGLSWVQGGCVSTGWGL